MQADDARIQKALIERMVMERDKRKYKEILEKNAKAPIERAAAVHSLAAVPRKQRKAMRVKSLKGIPPLPKQKGSRWRTAEDSDDDDDTPLVSLSTKAKPQREEVRFDSMGRIVKDSGNSQPTDYATEKEPEVSFGFKTKPPAVASKMISPTQSVVSQRNFASASVTRQSKSSSTRLNSPSRAVSGTSLSRGKDNEGQERKGEKSVSGKEERRKDAQQKPPLLHATALPGADLDALEATRLRRQKEKRLEKLKQRTARKAIAAKATERKASASKSSRVPKKDSEGRKKDSEGTSQKKPSGEKRKREEKREKREKKNTKGKARDEQKEEERKKEPSAVMGIQRKRVHSSSRATSEDTPTSLHRKVPLYAKSVPAFGSSSSSQSVTERVTGVKRERGGGEKEFGVNVKGLEGRVRVDDIIAKHGIEIDRDKARAVIEKAQKEKKRREREKRKAKKNGKETRKEGNKRREDNRAADDRRSKGDKKKSVAQKKKKSKSSDWPSVSTESKPGAYNLDDEYDWEAELDQVLSGATDRLPPRKRDTVETIPIADDSESESFGSSGSSSSSSEERSSEDGSPMTDSKRQRALMKRRVREIAEKQRRKQNRKRLRDSDESSEEEQPKRKRRRKKSLVGRLDDGDDLKSFIVDEGPYANDSDNDDFQYGAEFQEVLGRLRRGRQPASWRDEESSDECMEAGFDDVEAEERRSAAVANREDRRALEEEKERQRRKAELRRQKKKKTRKQ